RSQGKRLMARVDRFKVVILDFDNVDTIGQAFADEVFRVFAKQHPHIELMPLRTNKNVQQMIQRALSSSAEPDAPPETI
ncbi:MAG TPA: STAS-like domain-containing protein, partial [Candidatus Hodarchaeales archaeon]|nr:STAS-like domain-containing protein [Candidatus Hodarchaeales archaeon]